MSTYIFDFDGVIVNSMTIWSKTMVKILDENNVSYPDNIIEIITPLGMKKTAEYFATLGIKGKTADEILELILDRMSYEYKNNILAKPFVENKLKELKKSGASINLLTASPHKMFEPCLKRIGLYDLFDNLFSCDDFNLPKSEPEIYFEVSKILNKDVSECFFLDDNLGAVSAAKKAGMKVYGVYDETSADCEEMMKSIALKYIYDFSQL